jgi:hypothetical protein
MAAWQRRPSKGLYLVLLIDAIVINVRDSRVANRPVYVVIGVDMDGERDVLGLWLGSLEQADAVRRSVWARDCARCCFERSGSGGAGRVVAYSFFVARDGGSARSMFSRVACHGCGWSGGSPSPPRGRRQRRDACATRDADAGHRPASRG